MGDVDDHLPHMREVQYDLLQLHAQLASNWTRIRPESARLDGPRALVDCNE